MRAVVYAERGPPAVFREVEIERPAPRDDEVLLRVHAASVNSWDWELLSKEPSKVRLGRRSDPRYKILGADVAGTVEAVGTEVGQFRPGDQVFGDLCNSGWGGFAEYVCARGTSLMPKPADMTFEQAAATPQAGLLALQAINKGGPVRKGHRVLVNGAGGGVGTFAVQMVKSSGAEVTGVDRRDKLDMLKTLGADHVMDYREEDFTQGGQRYDLIIDPKMDRPLGSYKRALGPRGRYITVGGKTGPIVKLIFFGWAATLGSRKRLRLLLYRPNRQLGSLTDLIVAGKVAPVIDKCYPLGQAGDAIQRLGNGDVRGKLVVVID
jgi:NADPH:quinone reductase-like Zn-dependent oxidoreductase